MNGTFPTSRSNPGIVQVRDEYDDRSLVTAHNPGDTRPLSLLSRTKPVGRGKVFVRERVANFCYEWHSYQAEIRRCFILFYASRKQFKDEDYQLSELYSVLSFRNCEVQELLIHGRGDVLHLKSGGNSVFISFDNDDTLKEWVRIVTRISAQPRIGVDDFDVVSPIGIGAGGKVFLVKKKGSSELLAMKVVDKRKAIFKDQFHFQHAVDERALLELATSNPFCVQMRYCFQTLSRVYFVMDFYEGGDIFGYMWGRRKSVGEAKTKVVAAQILLALEFIHSTGFIYRDLKPENILIDNKGFIRLTDFGLSKMMRKGVGLERTNTICGTFSYLAPEMLSGRYNSSVDIWTFGILIYQLISGITPCDARSVEDARRYFRRGNPVEYNPELMSDEVTSLLRALITPKVMERLGCGEKGISEIKSHPFFADIDWDNLTAKNEHDELLDVSYINRVKEGVSEETQAVRNFDTEDLRNVHFEEDYHSLGDDDWTIFPMLQWHEKGGDLHPHYLLGFDFSHEEISCNSV